MLSIFGVSFQYMNAIIWQDGVTIYMANIIYFIHYKQLKMPLVRFNLHSRSNIRSQIVA